MTLTALVTIGGGAFAVALLQQQANAAVVNVAGHNKCSSDIITCTQKKTPHYPAKDSTPFNLPIPFP